MIRLSNRRNEVRLGEIADLIQYGYTAKSTAQPKGSKYLRITDIQNDHVDWTRVPHVTIDSDAFKRYSLKRGDIVFARSGATVGKSFLIQDDPGNAIFASYLIRVRCTPTRLEPEYAALFFRSEDYWRQIREGSAGTGQPNFNGTKLGDLVVPLRPLEEQRQIVASLSTFLARSKSAHDEVARIPLLAARYKQAILAAAFRGDLTQSWRDTRAESQNDALEELSRLRFNHFRREGKKEQHPASPSWKPAIDLPGGWSCVSVDQLATLVQYGSSAKTSDLLPGGVPVLRMGNILDGKLDYRKLKYLPKTHNEFPELLLTSGDILFNRTNSAELVGKTAVYSDTGHPTSFASYLIRIRVIGYLPELLSAYINSAFGREWVRSVVNQQVGQANVNGSKLRELGVPLPPMDEQKELWARIKKAFAAIDQVAIDATRAMELIDRLDQATLAKAFRGELVSQMDGCPDAADYASTRKEGVTAVRDTVRTPRARKSRTMLTS